MDYFFTENQAPTMDLEDARKRSNRVGLAFFILMTVSFVAALVIQVLFLILFPNANGTWMLWTVTILSLYVCAAPLSYLLFRTVKADVPEKRKMPLSALARFLFIGFALMIAGVMLGNIINGTIETIFGIEQDSAVGEAVEESPLWLTCIYTLGIAPLLEEVFFRKLLIDRMRPLGQWVCLLVSGVFFGLFHGNIEQFCYATLLGIVLAYIYYNTRNVWYCVAIHSIINFFCGVLGTIIQRLSPVDFLDETLTQEALTQLIMKHPIAYSALIGSSLLIYAFAIVGLYFIIRHGRKLVSSIEPCPIPKGQRFRTVALNVGTILFVISCVASMILFMIPTPGA